MKSRKKVFITLISLVSSAVVASGIGVSFAAYARYVKVVDSSGNNIPIATAAYRNTSLYLIPTAWNSLLSGATSVANCYVACCMYKSTDESVYEWQFIRTCDAEKAIISDNRTQITISSTDYQTYKFTFDVTYYDRLSFHRIGYTDKLEEYMTEVKDKFTSRSTDTKPVPLDWRNIDDDNLYRRYDASHRQSYQTKSNVFTITSTNSGGAYGFLAWGEWMSNTIVA